MEQAGSATSERDMALAMHETFLGSGSEDALSPRFQNLDIRSSGSTSPRTPPRSSPTLHRNTNNSSFKTSPADHKLSQQLGQKVQKSDGETNSGGANGAGKLLLGDEAFLKSLRMTEFEHHESGVARLNNGSFGACPRSVQLKQEQWVQAWLKQPDSFYYGPLQTGLWESRQIVAAHVNCSADELVLIDNVTTAASIVAMDVMWGFVDGRYQKGDSILLINFAYGAVKQAFEAYAVRAGAHMLIADIPFPVSSTDEILASFEKALRGAQKEGRVIRLAVIDHVVSMPSVILPVKELVAMCRSYGVEKIFVDGAQAVGNLRFNVEEIDADYYTGNLHKWFFAPSTVAFFHCKAEYLARLHHPIVSHNFGKGLSEECAWVGTRDYSAMLAVPAAFEFMNKLPGGLEAMMDQNHKKVVAAGKMLAKAWGTHCGVAPELCASMMMVELPPGLQIKTPEETFALRTRLRQEFSIEVHTFTPPMREGDSFPAKGVTAHLRISHHIYNTWDEYIRLRDVINALVVEKSNNKK